MIKDGGRYEVHRHWHNRRPRRQSYDEICVLSSHCVALHPTSTQIQKFRDNGEDNHHDCPFKLALCSEISRISDFVFREEFDERSSPSRRKGSFCTTININAFRRILGRIVRRVQQYRPRVSVSDTTHSLSLPHRPERSFVRRS